MPQFGDLLEVVGGFVRVVTDGQPDASKREVDIVVPDLLRAFTEIDPGLTQVDGRTGGGGVMTPTLLVLICLMLRPGLSSVIVTRFIIPPIAPGTLAGARGKQFIDFCLKASSSPLVYQENARAVCLPRPLPQPHHPIPSRRNALPVVRQRRDPEEAAPHRRGFQELFARRHVP